MAISEMGLSIGLRRSLQDQKDYVETKTPPSLYTQQEITNMMFNVPQGLTAEKAIETPIGTWQIEEGVTVFDSKSKEEIDRITLPSLKQKLSKLAERIFQMG